MKKKEKRRKIYKVVPLKTLERRVCLESRSGKKKNLYSVKSEKKFKFPIMIRYHKKFVAQQLRLSKAYEEKD